MTSPAARTPPPEGLRPKASPPADIPFSRTVRKTPVLNKASPLGEAEFSTAAFFSSASVSGKGMSAGGDAFGRRHSGGGVRAAGLVMGPKRPCVSETGIL